MDKTALFQLTYGLYVLTTKTEQKDNGCIVDAVMQLTDEPVRLAVCVNKDHLTNEMIKKRGAFNLSVLDVYVEQETFANFGYQSGRDADKFQQIQDLERGKNGIYYITKGTNAYLECEVEAAYEYGSHTLFVAQVLEAKKLTEVDSITYAGYRERLKNH